MALTRCAAPGGVHAAAVSWMGLGEVFAGVTKVIMVDGGYGLVEFSGVTVDTHTHTNTHPICV